MPNWTYNRLTVEGEPGDVQEFIEAVLGETGEGNGGPAVLSFERHLPTPPTLLGERGDPGGGRFPAWRNWRTQHWGTKWDAYWSEVLARDEGSVTYSFATAWSPPDAWLAHVSDAHPGLTFRLEFCEEMAQFAGRGVWHRGELVEHEPLDPDEVGWMEWEDVEDE